MHSPTYGDIIDEKVVEWQQGLDRLTQMVEKATADQKNPLSARVESLRSAIADAVGQLRALDAQETAQNTLATKEKILNIFSFIDKDFAEFQEKAPFML